MTSGYRPNYHIVTDTGNMIPVQQSWPPDRNVPLQFTQAGSYGAQPLLSPLILPTCLPMSTAGHAWHPVPQDITLPSRTSIAAGASNVLKPLELHNSVGSDFKHARPIVRKRTRTDTGKPTEEVNFSPRQAHTSFQSPLNWNSQSSEVLLNKSKTISMVSVDQPKVLHENAAVPVQRNIANPTRTTSQLAGGITKRMSLSDLPWTQVSSSASSVRNSQLAAGIAKRMSLSDLPWTQVSSSASSVRNSQLAAGITKRMSLSDLPCTQVPSSASSVLTHLANTIKLNEEKEVTLAENQIMLPSGPGFQVPLNWNSQGSKPLLLDNLKTVSMVSGPATISWPLHFETHTSDSKHTLITSSGTTLTTPIVYTSGSQVSEKPEVPSKYVVVATNGMTVITMDDKVPASTKFLDANGNHIIAEEENMPARANNILAQKETLVNDNIIPDRKNWKVHQVINISPQKENIPVQADISTAWKNWKFVKPSSQPYKYLGTAVNKLANVNSSESAKVQTDNTKVKIEMDNHSDYVIPGNYSESDGKISNTGISRARGVKRSHDNIDDVTPAEPESVDMCTVQNNYNKILEENKKLGLHKEGIQSNDVSENLANVEIKVENVDKEYDVAMEIDVKEELRDKDMHTEKMDDSANCKDGSGKSADSSLKINDLDNMLEIVNDELECNETLAPSDEEEVGKKYVYVTSPCQNCGTTADFHKKGKFCSQTCIFDFERKNVKEVEKQRTMPKIIIGNKNPKKLLKNFVPEKENVPMKTVNKKGKRFTALEWLSYMEQEKTAASPVPKQKTLKELQEEEDRDLQLAIALSKREAENKASEIERMRSAYSIRGNVIKEVPRSLPKRQQKPAEARQEYPLVEEFRGSVKYTYSKSPLCSAKWKTGSLIIEKDDINGWTIKMIYACATTPCFTVPLTSQTLVSRSLNDTDVYIDLRRSVGSTSIISLWYRTNHKRDVHKLNDLLTHVGLRSKSAVEPKKTNIQYNPKTVNIDKVNRLNENKKMGNQNWLNQPMKTHEVLPIPGRLESGDHVSLPQRESVSVQPVASTITSTKTFARYTSNSNMHTSTSTCTTASVSTCGSVHSGWKTKKQCMCMTSDHELYALQKKKAELELKLLEKRKQHEDEMFNLKKQILQAQIDQSNHKLSLFHDIH